MSINTIQESKIIEYLKNNFDELLNKNSIKVIDVNEDSMIFKCESGQGTLIENGHNYQNINLKDKFKAKVKKETYNVKECADVLGICENTMRELINRKDFPVIRVGRRILIPCRAFHKYINSEGLY